MYNPFKPDHLWGGYVVENKISLDNQAKVNAEALGKFVHQYSSGWRKIGRIASALSSKIPG